MYCPACGVEISDEGSFCASCGKNIAYLTIDRQSYVGKLKQNTVTVKKETVATETEPSLKISPMELASLETVTDELAPAEGEVAGTSEVTEKSTVPQVVADEETVMPKGFYCNNCGSFLFPEDNYCYDCGKKTQKKYYHNVVSSKKNMKGLLLGFSALLLLALAYYIVVAVLLNGIE